MTNHTGDGEASREKPQVNEVARIVNPHFLQSPYEGKDWESVRKDLIQELTAELAQARQADRQRMLDGLLEKEVLCCYGHSETRLVHYRSDFDGSYCYTELVEGESDIHFLRIADSSDEDFEDWKPVDAMKEEM